MLALETLTRRLANFPDRISKIPVTTLLVSLLPFDGLLSWIILAVSVKVTSVTTATSFGGACTLVITLVAGVSTTGLGAFSCGACTLGLISTGVFFSSVFLTSFISEISLVSGLAPEVAGMGVDFFWGTEVVPFSSSGISTSSKKTTSSS